MKTLGQVSNCRCLPGVRTCKLGSRPRTAMSWAPIMSMWSGWAQNKMYMCLRKKVGKECNERGFHYPNGFGLKFDCLFVPQGSQKRAVVKPTAEGEER